VQVCTLEQIPDGEFYVRSVKFSRDFVLPEKLPEKQHYKVMLLFTQIFRKQELLFQAVSVFEENVKKLY